MFFSHFQIRFIFLILSISLAGCYGDINVNCEFQAPGCFDRDSANLFFFHSSEVKRPAAGISAFPDGGVPKILFKKVTFSRYNNVQKSLETILDYGSIPLSPGRWKFNMYVRNDTVAFMTESVSGWENELKWGLDSIIFLEFNYSYIYNVISGELTKTASDYKIAGQHANVKTSDMKMITRELTYKERGIDLDEIFPAGKKERISELVKLKGNQEYRNAIIETVADELTGEDITFIINGINEYINNLRGYDRLLKKEYAEKTIAMLRLIRHQ